jgi:hypothetical protein
LKTIGLGCTSFGPPGDKSHAVIAAERLIEKAGEFRDLLEAFDSGARPAQEGVEHHQV